LHRSTRIHPHPRGCPHLRLTLHHRRSARRIHLRRLHLPHLQSAHHRCTLTLRCRHRQMRHHPLPRTRTPPRPLLPLLLRSHPPLHPAVLQSHHRSAHHLPALRSPPRLRPQLHLHLHLHLLHQEQHRSASRIQ